MEVYQIRLKVFLLQDIPVNQVQAKLAAFLDKGLSLDAELMRLHEKNGFKNYCFDLLYPIEPDKVYKKENIYTVTIRTIDVRLARYFSEVCVNTFTNEIKGLTVETKIIMKKVISSVFTLTPIVLKTDQGYWRTHMALDEFEKRLKVNLIKKWNQFEEDKLDEDFQMYTMLEFLNAAPIRMEYKGITLLGDKIRLQIADNKTAQDLAYMMLGTGACEMNSRGAGFVNYRWL